MEKDIQKRGAGPELPTPDCSASDMASDAKKRVDEDFEIMESQVNREQRSP